MINIIRLFFVLVLFVVISLSQSVFAGPIIITPKQPFPNVAYRYISYVGTYNLVARPGQTVSFYNRFPHCVKQTTDDDRYCKETIKLPTGECTIQLILDTSDVYGEITSEVEVCLTGLPVCEHYLITVQVVDQPNPAITSINPSVGATKGGTRVAVIGVFFTGTIAVKFGTADAGEFSVNTDTQITATSPTYDVEGTVGSVTSFL